MAIGGIPDISSKLVVLPHETQLQFDPYFVNVRVVMTIPTKKPGDVSLSDLAQLNKDLNIERWRITRIRPKGSSSSKVYMRMDKRSFDTISARDGNYVNWILGPISINKEVHKAQPKKSNPQSVKDNSVATPNSGTVDRHLKPPFVESVEDTPVGAVGTILTRNERSELSVSNKAVLFDGHPQRRPQSQPKPNV